MPRYRFLYTANAVPDYRRISGIFVGQNLTRQGWGVLTLILSAQPECNCCLSFHALVAKIDICLNGIKLNVRARVNWG